MEGKATVPARDAGYPSYRRLLQRLTRPRLLTVDEAGGVVEAPPALIELADGTLEGGLHDLDEHEPDRVMACFERSGRLGMARAHIRREGLHHPFLLNIVDLRADHGVFACVVSEDIAPDDVALYRSGLTDEDSPPPRHRSASVRLTADGHVLEAYGSVPGVIDERHGDVALGRLARLIHPDDVGTGAAVFAEALAAPRVGHRARMRLRSFDGGWRWVEAHLQVDPRSDEGRPEVLATLTDVDQDVRTGEELAQSVQRFRTFAAAIPIGVFGTDDVGQLRFANDAFRTITGLGPDDTDWMSAVHPDDLSALADAVQRFGFGGEVLDLELRTRPTADRGERTVRLLARAIRAEDGKLLDVVGSLDDVTERTALHRRLTYAATHDALTGLANRAHLEDELGRRLDQAHSARAPVAVVFVDLDGFKRINDSLGHPAGDLLLLELAGRVQAEARDGDLVGRFGGDEFVVVADHTGGADGALGMAHRIMAALVRPAEVRGTLVRPRASIGVALGWRRDTDAETLLRDADAAMYEAKARGPNAVWMADAGVRARAERRFAIESALVPALQRDELRLAHQPIVTLATGRIETVEALLRWDSPVFGPTPPSELIPVAEETGHIHEITRWVTRRAARDLVTMRTVLGGPPGRVTVNLSSSQLSAPDFLDRFLAEVAAAGAGPTDLVVELTESLPIAHDVAAIQAIEGLHGAGVGLAIDDFGSGYGSFDYLVRLPVDVLKVDQHLTRRLPTNARARRVLRGIVAMCRDMGVSVVAEGIETAAQMEVCGELGVTAGQGFYLARPADPEELVRQVAAGELSFAG